MNVSEQLYQDLLNYLVAWKPKETMPNIGGEGWNEHNVLDIDGTLPTGIPFDFAHLSTPTKVETPVTTGSTHIQRSTQTFTVDLYCKRAGTGNAMKKATKLACEENTEKIVTFFASLGFTNTMSNTNLNYSGNSTARQTMYFTRIFVDN
jgi:hypothetical protein